MVPGLPEVLGLKRVCASARSQFRSLAPPLPNLAHPLALPYIVFFCRRAFSFPTRPTRLTRRFSVATHLTSASPAGVIREENFSGGGGGGDDSSEMVAVSRYEGTVTWTATQSFCVHHPYTVP